MSFVPRTGLLLALSIVLTGCSLMPVRRRLPVPKAPENIQTVAPQKLVAELDQRWQDLHTLTATVKMQVTEYKKAQGEAETLPPATGWILLQKPYMLRVSGNFMGARAFDMVSNGKTFTLQIPSKNLVIRGPDTATIKSPNPLYNLRPGFFLAAMFVQGLDPADRYSVISDTETMLDDSERHLLSIPEYILNIARLNPGSQQMTEVRVVSVHREDLLPYSQDIYDDAGHLEARAEYRAYHRFGQVNYPSRITIHCPIAGIDIALTVIQVKENSTVSAGSFQLRLAPGRKIQQLN